MSEAAVRAIVDARRAALERRDAAAFLAAYAEDAVIFDLAPPLAHGLDAEVVERWLRSWDGAVVNEVELFRVDVAGEIAHALGLERVAGRQGGEARDIWWRFTLCLRRKAGSWRIAHEHTSLPMRKEAGRLVGATDLTPESGLRP